MKILPIFLAAALTLAAPAHTGRQEFHWFFQKTEDHSPPALPAELAFAEQYGGYGLVHTDEKVIYLTFDAGYENGNVEKVLDTLSAHDAPGCFFVLDNLIKNNTELVCRMFDEGHCVGNHTMKHHNMARRSDEELKNELEGLEALCLDCTGHALDKFYRPPEGTFSEANLKTAEALGYKTIFWSYAYADWDNDRQPDPEKSLEKLLAHVHPGEILLLHPTSATNAAILDGFLCALEADGWRFGSLSELGGEGA